MKPRYIVAEISKNWPSDDPRPIISAQFEDVINLNFERGYRLIDWKIDRVVADSMGRMNETIIAIFALEQTS